MSIESPVPRTAVPLGITDPVESARAELKAALSAIEEKTIIPTMPIAVIITLLMNRFRYFILFITYM